MFVIRSFDDSLEVKSTPLYQSLIWLPWAVICWGVFLASLKLGALNSISVWSIASIGCLILAVISTRMTLTPRPEETLISFTSTNVKFKDIYSKTFRRLDFGFIEEILLIENTGIKDSEGYSLPRPFIIFKLKKTHLSIYAKYGKYICGNGEIYVLGISLTKKSLRALQVKLNNRKYAGVKIRYKNRIQLNAKY